MSYASLTAELAGALPGLSTLLAGPFIQRAYRDICNARLWSFQTTDAAIICPAQITTGSFSITNGLATITANAAASAALLGYVTGNPTLLQLQIRFGGSTNSAAVGQIYNIRSVDATTDPTAIVLTLQRAVVEATNAASGYQVYRCYVQPPISDFLRFESCVDMAQALPVALDRTSAYFDLRDPQRTSQGLAFYMGQYQASQAATANPLGGPSLYELWPHPTQGQNFYVRMRRIGPPLNSPTAVQPDIIPDQLILDKALYHYAYPWAKANAGHFPAMKGVNWADLVTLARQSYADSYRDVKRQDDELRLQSVWNRGHGLRGPRTLGFPIDANFVQSHLLNF